MRVVIGGGIAGVCCAQELARLNPREEVVVVTATDTVLEVKSVFAWTKYLEEVDIFEKTADQFLLTNPNIRIVHDFVQLIDPQKKIILLQSGASLEYSKLCLCTGVRPKLIASHPRILGIRDIFSVQHFLTQLRVARTVVVVGNGGIALELVHELTNFDVHFVVRESYIGAALFDESASDFITPQLLQRQRSPHVLNQLNNGTERLQALENNSLEAVLLGSEVKPRLPGSGLGPAWLKKTDFHDSLGPQILARGGTLQLHYDAEIAGYSDDSGGTWTFFDKVLDDPECQMKSKLQDFINNWRASSPLDDTASVMHPFHVITTQGEIIGCDLVVSATGVQPNLIHLAEVAKADRERCSNNGRVDDLAVDNDGFLLVNKRMMTSIPDIFAAGDCCSYHPTSSVTMGKSSILAATVPIAAPHFFQMRLWTQARFLGTYAAQCMENVEDNYGTDQHLELFAHVTRFFGLKVVLLGRYNGQQCGALVEKAVKRTVFTTAATIQGMTEQDTKAEAEAQYDATDVHVEKKARSSLEEDEPSNRADFEIWSRVTPGKQFIKLVVYRGKLIGALLIGDTDLEEVFENLILNQLDISALGPEMLDPEIDLADYFD